MSNIESSLIKTIIESDLFSVTRDIAEIGVDAILQEGILKEIPILSTLSGLAKTGATVRDYLYLKKIYRFLGELNRIPLDERQNFIDVLGNDETEREKTGENLLLIIDRLDNINKPEILGRMFCDFLSNTISKSDFMSLAKSLELFNLELIINLNSYYNSDARNNDYPSDDILQSLASSGLVGMYFGSGAINDGGGGYCRNKLGKLFVEYVV